MTEEEMSPEFPSMTIEESKRIKQTFKNMGTPVNKQHLDMMMEIHDMFVKTNENIMKLGEAINTKHGEQVLVEKVLLSKIMACLEWPSTVTTEQINEVKDGIIKAIVDAAKTGQRGDGLISVYPIGSLTKIRNGATDEQALR